MVRTHPHVFDSCIDLLAGSDIVRINVLGMNIIVTNTLEASADLLDKRSSTYSNRPTHGLTMIRDLCVSIFTLRGLYNETRLQLRLRVVYWVGAAGYIFS